MVLHLSESRTVPYPPEQAFPATISAPLTALFPRRVGVIPAVREVVDAPAVWGEVGDSRTIRTADGGSMVETLTSHVPQRSFGYDLSDVRGPLKPLVSTVAGRWDVEPVGTGSRITWTWDLHPRGLAGALGLRVFALFWPAYARAALARLEERLTDGG